MREVQRQKLKRSWLRLTDTPEEGKLKRDLGEAQKREMEKQGDGCAM